MEKGFFEAFLLMPEYRKINEYMTGNKVSNKNVSLVTMLFFLGLQYVGLHTHTLSYTKPVQLLVRITKLIFIC